MQTASAQDADAKRERANIPSGQNAQENPHPEGAGFSKGFRVVPLTTLRHVCREMGIIYRRMERGILDSDKGGKLVWVLRQMADTLKANELEAALLEIKARLALSSGAIVPQLPDPYADGDANNDGEGADTLREDQEVLIEPADVVAPAEKPRAERAPERDEVVVSGGDSKVIIIK